MEQPHTGKLCILFMVCMLLHGRAVPGHNGCHAHVTAIAHAVVAHLPCLDSVCSKHVGGDYTHQIFPISEWTSTDAWCQIWHAVCAKAAAAAMRKGEDV